jgi:hypothetical protein
MYARDMPTELVWPRERLITMRTRVRPRAGVRPHVLREIGRLRERLVAVGASEGLLTRMSAFVDRERSRNGERFATPGDVALVRFYR